MKRLDEVEPRTLLSTLNTPGDSGTVFIITQSGSYYLGSNLAAPAGKDGIVIAADNVSIDLNGFAVICGTNGTNQLIGIRNAGSRHDISVENGTVRGWGRGNVYLSSRNGILRRLRLTDSPGNGGNVSTDPGDGFDGRYASSVVISDCVATGNAGDGFAAGTAASITNCVSNGNVLSGFSADRSSLTNCTADLNGIYGFYAFSACRLHDCSATSTYTASSTSAGFFIDRGSSLVDCLSTANLGNGIQAGNACSLMNCTVGLNGKTGISTGDNCSIINCNSSQNGSDGIHGGDNCSFLNCNSSLNGNDGMYVGGSTTVLNNNVSQNANLGIHCVGINNRIDGNHAFGNQLGVYCVNFGFHSNVVIRNTAHDNVFADYIPGSDAHMGPVGLPSTATSPWANF